MMMQRNNLTLLIKDSQMMQKVLKYLKKKLKSSTESALGLGREIERLENEKASLSAQLAKVFGLAFGKKKELTEKINNKNIEIADAKKKLDSVRTERDNASKSIDSQKNVVERQRQAALSLIGICEREVKDVENRIRDLNGKIAAKEAEIESLLKIEEENRQAEEKARADAEKREAEARKLEEERLKAEAQHMDAESIEEESIIDSSDNESEMDEIDEDDYDEYDEDEFEEDEYYYKQPDDYYYSDFQESIEETIERVSINERFSETKSYGKTKESLDSDFQAGKIVQFGNYRQGRAGEIKPIEWIVVERKGNGVKLLSLKGLETLPYHNEDGNITWGESFLRSWLNGSFFNAAFSDEEMQSILLSDTIAERHPKYSTKPGKDSKDKVFIFNYQEADHLQKFSKMYLSEWAIDNDKLFKNWYGTDDYALWWLRTPGSRATRSCVMGDYISGKDIRTNMGVAVRPAIWVDLNAAFFGGDFATQVVDAEPEISINDLLEILTEKYRTEEKPSTVDEFEKDNSKYSDLLKSLKYSCFRDFGMNYGAFLKERGFLRDKADDIAAFDPSEMISKLQVKYAESESKLRTVEDLINDNPEYEETLKLLIKYCQDKYGDTAARYLRAQGILYTAEDGAAIKQKLAEEKNAEKAAARARERAKVVEKLPVRDAVSANRVVKLFERLEEIYPEHLVFALDSIDDTARETLSKLSKEIGYESPEDMLLAYGYEKISGDEVRAIRSEVIYKPGNEPAVIKPKVDSVLRRLEEYYPNKTIERSIQVDHKRLSQSISGVYQWLGYSNIGDFLSAYGYNCTISYGGGNNGAGRPSTTNQNELIEELRKRSGGNPYPGMKELKEANPDLTGKIRTISNKANELFGMGFSAYLKQEGIIGERPKAAPKEKPEKVAKPKVKSTISRNALPVLEQRFNENTYDMSLQEVIDSLEGLTVKLVNATNYISITGSERSDEVLMIPCGVDAIDARAFVGRKELKKVILSDTVKLIDRKAFEDCDCLEEVVVANSSCKIATDAFIGCNKVRIVIDRTDVIERFLTRISKAERDDYKRCIDVIDACFKTAGGRPEGFWAGVNWKFSFNIGTVLYQTELEPLGGDYEAVDTILESIYSYERVKGTLDYFKDIKTGSEVISKTILLDNQGNIK